MKKRIFKYHLPETPGVHELTLPFNAHILNLQAQGHRPTIWAIVTEGMRGIERRRFRVAYTGEAIPDDPGTFIGTCQITGIVIHVFEVTNA